MCVFLLAGSWENEVSVIEMFLGRLSDGSLAGKELNFKAELWRPHSRSMDSVSDLSELG